MNKSLIILLSFLIAFTEKGNNPDFLVDINNFETLNKTISITSKKANLFHKGKKYRFKEDKYFRLIPPEYSEIVDTLLAFDESKFHKEMEPFYAVSAEQILVKEGGYKWIEKKSVITACYPSVEYKLTSSNTKHLVYVKEKSEYMTINRLTLKNGFHGGNIADEQLLKERQEMRSKAFKMAKSEKLKLVIKGTRLINNGYIEEVKLDDLLKDYTSEDKIIKFKKGQWTSLKVFKPKFDCESSSNSESKPKRN